MKRRTHSGWQAILQAGLMVWCAFGACVFAQTGEAVQADAQETAVDIKPLTAAEAAVGTAPADYVSIHVDGGTIRQVLNAFSMQTQRNVVIGPEVVSDGVSIHLNNVRWDEALDVILKPYGFGYRKVGDTVVVSKLENLAGLAAVEPLETKVFTLRYLDAGDVKELVEKQLSPRGTVSIKTARGQIGWQFAAQGGAQGAAAELGKLERLMDQKDKEQPRSKTLIVSDVPSNLARIGEVLTEVDNMPRQVLVESRFIEVNASLLKNAGLDLKQIGLDMGADDEGQVIAGTPLAGNSFNIFSWSAGLSANAFINLLQQDDDTKVLSAPRILAQNNQEATIIVGTKFPIIKSEIQASASTTPTKTTELERYENSGIQLNVVPQICDHDYVSMIVHPSVITFVGFEEIKDGSEIIVRYPIINTREAETQIMVKNGETIVIGGLLEERKKEGVQKIPLIGDIPLLGRLFRRNTTDNMTVDLLIFLSATIVDEDNYSVILEKGAEPAVPPAVTAPAPEATPVETVIEDLSAAGASRSGRTVSAAAVIPVG